MNGDKGCHLNYNISINITTVNKTSTAKAVKATKKMTVNNDTQEKPTY